MTHLQQLNNALQPLFFTSKLIALDTLAFKNKNLKVSYTCITYNILAGLIFFGCFVYACEDIKTFSDESDNTISEATGWFDLYAGVTSQTTAIFLNCINNKKFIHFFKSLAEVDDVLGLLGQEIDYQYSKKFVVGGVLCVAMEFLVTFSTDYVLFIEDESKMYLVTSYFPIITTGVVKLQLVTMIFLLQQRFSALNRTMQEIGKDISYDECWIVNKLHDLHNKLCQLCCMLNYLYGVQFLLTVGTAFTICVSEIYYCYTQLKENHEHNLFADLYFSCQWAALQILEIYVTIFFAESTYEEIRKTSIHLHEIYNTTSSKTIRNFSMYMMYNTTKFTACGLFNLDYKFLHAVHNMDIDDEFDVELDPIKHFLTHKLEEIRNRNDTLEKNMDDKKQLLSKHFLEDNKTPDIEIGQIWSRIHDNRYIFGFYITNKENVSIKLSNVLLNWNSSSLITYRISVYNVNVELNSFDCATTRSIRETGCAVLAIEKPIFLKEISLDITGRIIFNIADSKRDIPLPNFRINAADFSNFEVRNWKLEDLMSVWSCGYRYDVTIERTDVDGDLDIDRVLELDCMFEKIMVGDRKIFTIDGQVSRGLWGTLIEVVETGDGVILAIICRNEDVFLQCLYLMYEKMDGLVILPKAYAEIIDGDISKKLSESLLREISLIKQLNTKNDKHIQGKHELFDAQLHTDLLYTKI